MNSVVYDKWITQITNQTECWWIILVYEFLGFRCGVLEVFIFRRVHKIAKSDSCLCHVCCLSVRLYVRPSTWNSSAPTARIFMNLVSTVSVNKWFSWNFIFEYFSKICWENSVSLKSRKNNWYFTWRSAFVYGNMSLNYALNEKCFRQKSLRNSKHTFYVE